MTAWERAALWLWAVTTTIAGTWAGLLTGRGVVLAVSLIAGLAALVCLHRAVWSLRDTAYREWAPYDTDGDEDVPDDVEAAS